MRGEMPEAIERSSTASRPSQPLIEHQKDGCEECWSCVRVCPVKAIRVTGGISEVIQEKCVACGLCVHECARGGHVVRDDTVRVRELLEGDRPVIALLATEFIAAMHPMTPAQVEQSLLGLGFHTVETTLLGEEAVAAEYERALTKGDILIQIRSTCPVVVDFVRKYHPVFATALAPVVPPYVAQARLIRSLYPDEVAIVYVSPCYARKDEVHDPAFDDAVDVAIDFSELKRLIEHARERTHRMGAPRCASRRPGVLKEVSLTDGFPRQTLVTRDMTSRDVVSVRGLADLRALLDAMVRGEAAPVVIDALHCEGCIDGPAVNRGLSLFEKRNIDAAARDVPGAVRVSTRQMLKVLPAVDLRRSFTARPVRVPEATNDQIDRILRDGGFASRDAVIDCGACGYPTCVEHAEAIFRGDSSWEMCFPLQRRRLRELERRATALETLDELTGLWNARAFSERLQLEMARHQRYGAPLSLVLLDVDGLGIINERFGERGGDVVLRAVGQVLSSTVRKTDMVAREPGDRFAVLLPHVGKTVAFAVAEKLRAAVAEHRFDATDGNTEGVRVTMSAGVASASPSAPDARAVYEAAQRALLEAMEAGRDQVRIAPG